DNSSIVRRRARREFARGDIDAGIRLRNRDSKTLVFAEKTPLPQRELGHRQAADADTLGAQHAQPDGLAKLAQVTGLRRLDDDSQAGFVLPAGFGLGQNLAAMADASGQQFKPAFLGIAGDFNDEFLFELVAWIAQLANYL